MENTNNNGAKSKPIIICAQQRSGTTLLVKALGEMNECRAYGEVFDPYYYHSKENFSFFYFKKKLIEKNIDFTFPSTKNQKKIFEQFFHFLKSNNKKSFHVIDIKYDSWHHFNPVWHCSEQPPALLSWIKALNIPVIHIIRKNLLHQYISSEVAAKTGKYHYEKNENIIVENKKIIIKPNHCKFIMHRVKRNIKKHQGWFNNYPYYYQICYEDLIRNGVFSNRINNIISSITNNKIMKLKDPPLKKGIKNPLENVENKQQLVNVITQSVFAGYLNRE